MNRIKILALSAFLFAGTILPGSAASLRVCATIPDLGSLAEMAGGSDASVTILAQGPEDAHFIEAKPSFLTALHKADLFVESGMELEVGWVPGLLPNARNGNILPGGRGYLNASTAIIPLEVPTGNIDRSMGDVHAKGNPHYLLDPLNGLKVARLIAEKMSALKPEAGTAIEGRLKAFEKDIVEKLVGNPLAENLTGDKLLELADEGKLLEFVTGVGNKERLGGWLGKIAPFFGSEAVADHNLWPYFAKRFGLEIVGFLEPKPGVPPTTRHLAEIIDLMKVRKVKVILASPYFDDRPIRFVAEHSGAEVAHLGHQTGALPAARDYLATVDLNVRILTEALGKAK